MTELEPGRPGQPEHMDRWMLERGLGGVMVACVMACSLTSEPIGNEHGSMDGSGSGGGSATADGSSGSGTSMDSSTSGNDTSAGSDPCLEVAGGGSCETPGAQCSYGDDCGSWLYECEGGAWVQIDGSGCGGTPIACEEGPTDGDDCDFELSPEPCDPDGDCLDVLECEGYTWVAHALCTEQYCMQAAPLSDKPCDDPNRSCGVPTDCGTRNFVCTNDRWNFIGGGICTDPVACADAPVPNDACAQDGEVCDSAFPGGATLTCVDGKWD